MASIFTDKDTLHERWKSAKHVGASKPSMKVLVRKARMRRQFRELSNDEVFAWVPGTGSVNKVYCGYLEVHSSWVELPNIKEVEIEQGFDSNGVASATLTMDTLSLEPRTGVGGLFHTIERGWFAPFRGYRGAGERNDWYEVIREKSTQVMILAGYGNARIPIFSGLIDDTDLTSNPDMATITARDFGQLLTDQRIVFWAKHPQIMDPVTFADRKDNQEIDQKGTAGQASGFDGGHPPANATDGNPDSNWKSHGADNPDGAPWINIVVPAGVYQAMHINPLWGGLECWVSVWRKNAGEWYDPGKGVTPNGIPYVKHIPALKGGQQGYGFDEEIQLGDNSVFQLTFSNLHQDAEGKKVVYRAGVQETSFARRRPDEESKHSHWILVDDAADVVRVILQWMGLREWDVEDTGVRLKDKIVFNRQTTFIEIVNKIAEMVNFTFHMRPPEVFDEAHPDNNVDNSLGIAVFRMAQALPDSQRDGRVYEIRDDQTLTGIDAKLTDDPLAQHIRVRGKVSKNGKSLDGDRSQRVQYGYLPPWSRNDSIGNGGVKKVVVHYDELLTTIQECQIACMFIALREGLEAFTGQLECPALPFLYLDQQVSLFDRGTGLSTRLWIVSRSMNFSTGEDAKFTMNVGGSLIDVPDMVDIRSDLAQSLSDAGIWAYPLPATAHGQSNYGKVTVIG